MRYLFICLAAFMLFAIPALALPAPTVQDVTVTVNVPYIAEFTASNPAAFEFLAVCGPQEIEHSIGYHINTNMNGHVTAGFVGGATWNPNLTFYLYDGAVWQLPAAWHWYFVPGDWTNASWNSKVALAWPVAQGGYSGTCTFTCTWS